MIIVTIFLITAAVYQQSTLANPEHPLYSEANAPSDFNVKPQEFHLSSDIPTNVMAHNSNAGQPLRNGGTPLTQNHKHDSRTNQAQHGTNKDFEQHAKDEDSEIVGLPLLGLQALSARARVHALTARARARARLHHPLLLQPTPAQFLDDEDVMLSQPPSGIEESQPLLMQERRSFDPLKTNNLESCNPSTTTKKENPRNIGFARSSTTFPDRPPQDINQLLANDISGTPERVIQSLSRTLNSEEALRSAEYSYEEQRPQFSAIPTVYYNRDLTNVGSMPEIRVYDIDNSDEVYQGKKPGFSMIPPNWKPPPESNLYFQNDYQQYDTEEPALSILPGQWKNGDGYTTYYSYYDVIPISYDIPDDAYQSYYGRSAESGDGDEEEPSPFVGVKKQLDGWENNPLVWRPDSDNIKTEEAKERAADPHFHHGAHSHAHSFVHKHVLDHGKGSHSISLNHDTPSHHTSFSKQIGPISHYDGQHSAFVNTHENIQPHFSQTSGHVPQHQSSFSHSQAQSQGGGFLHSHGIPGHQLTINKQETPSSSFSHSQAQSQGGGFSHSHGIPGHQLTINKQQTTVIIPPGNQNFQISQVAGSNNAVSQSQGAGKIIAGGGLSPHIQTIQAAQVTGNHNSVSQSQTSNEAPFLSRQADPIVGAPFLVNPKRRRVYRDRDTTVLRLVLKRSVKGNTLNNKLADLLQTDLKGKNTHMGKVQGKTSTDSTPRLKRSVPLLRLVADPNAKLDVPKTLENMGTVVRNSFDNKRTPLYHLKNVVGSTKDALMSTLKIPPQDLFIPSKYKIIDRGNDNMVKAANPMYRNPNENRQTVGAINSALLQRISLRDKNKSKSNTILKDGSDTESSKRPELPREIEDPNNFESTYKKVGNMLRESIRSGQEALAHMGEIYHSARKALATSHHVSPRVILSSMRIPAVQRRSPVLPQNDKVMLITPKILQLKQEAVGAPHYSENFDDFVGVNHVMDSLGLSNPEAGPVGLRRVVLHPVNLPPPQLPERLRLQNKPAVPNLQARSNVDESGKEPAKKILKKYYLLADSMQPTSEQNVKDTLEVLDNAKKAVGAKTLKDFVFKMREGISTMFKDRLDQAKTKFVLRVKTGKTNFTDIKPDIRTLTDLRKKLVTPKFRTNASDVPSQLEEPFRETSPIVSKVLKIPENIPSEASKVPAQIKQQEEKEITDFLTNLFKSEANAANAKKQNQDISVPPVKKNEIVKHELSHGEKNDDILGARLPLTQQLLKPFMGRASKDQLRKFFQQYGDSIEEGEDEINEEENPTQTLGNDPNQGVIGAINPLLFRKDCRVTKAGLKCDNAQTTSTTKAPHKNSSLNEKEAKVVNKQSKIKTEVNDSSENQTETVGVKMTMGKALLTPFMGKLVKEEVQVYPPRGYAEGYATDSAEDNYRNAMKDQHQHLEVHSTDTNPKQLAKNNETTKVGTKEQFTKTDENVL